MTNNIQVTLIAFAGGIAFGALTVYALVLQRAAAGGDRAGSRSAPGNGVAFLRLISSHGPLEISCIVVGGIAGLRMGWALIRPGPLRRGTSLRREARAGGRDRRRARCRGSSLCGFCEGFVTGPELPVARAGGDRRGAVRAVLGPRDLARAPCGCRESNALNSAVAARVVDRAIDRTASTGRRPHPGVPRTLARRQLSGHLGSDWVVSRMRLSVLGHLEASVDDRPVALGGAKQRAVLAMLGLEANRAVTADRLIEGLWGEQPPPSAAKMVQNYVWRLRRAAGGRRRRGDRHARARVRAADRPRARGRLPPRTAGLRGGAGGRVGEPATGRRARRWRCFAAIRWRTWPTSRSRARRSAGSRSCA